MDRDKTPQGLKLEEEKNELFNNPRSSILRESAPAPNPSVKVNTFYRFLFVFVIAINISEA